jgi:hypothetical protein
MLFQAALGALRHGLRAGQCSGLVRSFAAEAAPAAATGERNRPSASASLQWEAAWRAFLHHDVQLGSCRSPTAAGWDHD